jgi:hypothetical protein
MTAPEQRPNEGCTEGEEIIVKDRQWSRLAGVSGILFVVLVYAGVFLVDTGLLGGLDEPPPDAGGEEFIAYFTSSHAALLLKSYLGLLAFCFFLVFVGGLCNAVWVGYERLPMLGLVAFGSGVTASALQLASTAVMWAQVRSAQRIEGLDPQIASVLREVQDILLVSAWFPLAAFLAAVALGVVLTPALLPRWLGWAAAVLAIGFLGVALLMAVAPYSLVWVLVYMLFAIWIIITSVILIRRARARGSEVKRAPATAGLR